MIKVKFVLLIVLSFLIFGCSEDNTFPITEGNDVVAVINPIEATLKLVKDFDKKHIYRFLRFYIG